jgi:hypothetical protein
MKKTGSPGCRSYHKLQPKVGLFLARVLHEFSD